VVALLALDDPSTARDELDVGVRTVRLRDDPKDVAFRARQARPHRCVIDGEVEL
jgi:hypothetical protein